MDLPAPTHVTLDEWIAREAIPFDPASTESLNAAVDRMVAALGESVQLLGFGEALHGSGGLLLLRNRLFQRLAEAHGYSAIAIESSFPRGRAVDEYVAGRGAESYDAVRDAGFSHGFGRADGNRELVEWMRRHNADPAHPVKLRFYGFDSPTEMIGSDSPRRLLHFALDYLASADAPGASERRRRIDELLGDDTDWENPAASFDPAKSVGRTPAATSLRIEAEDLITELRLRRPELSALSGASFYLEAEQRASVARHLLNYHAALATASDDRIARLLGIRDVIMAENLAYAVTRERGRGQVLAFAHNSHLKRGKAQWQLGPNLLQWWPAGSHLNEMLGPGYAVIGSGVGTSDAHGIDPPAAGTIDAHLVVAAGPARFIPTHRGRTLPTSATADLPTRFRGVKNSTYFPLTSQSLADFDWLAVMDSID